MDKERCLTFIKKNKELFDTSYPNWEKIYEEAKKEFGERLYDFTEFFLNRGKHPEYGLERLPSYFLNNPPNGKFTVPSNIEAIEAKAIYFPPDSFNQLIIENGPVIIGDSAFYRMWGLKELNIPDSVVEIEDQAFGACVNLEKITLGKGLKILGGDTFHSAEKVKEINLSEGLEKIGDGCFGNWESLETITIPDSVTYLGERCFYGCESLKEAFIGDNILFILYHCFGGCKSLSRVHLPNNIVKIDDKAFLDCSSLTSINISDSLVEIGIEAFKNTLIGKVDLPSITKIDVRAFEECATLYSININDRCTIIGDYAFKDCIQLTELNLPSAMKYISWGLCENCTNLEQVTFGTNIEQIRNDAFKNCGDLIIYFEGTKEQWKKIYNSRAFINTYFTVNCLDGKIIKRRG